MGFEHQVKTDVATATRAREALRKLGEWMMDDPFEDGSPRHWDVTFLSEVLLFTSPDDVVFYQCKRGPDGESYADPDGKIATVRDYFYERYWPGEGEGLLWWFEIAWLYKFPGSVLSKAREYLREADAESVWWDIVGESSKMSGLMGGLLGDIFPGSTITRAHRYE